MIVRKRGESSGPKEDSVYFTAPAAFAVGRLERWRTSRLRNSHGEEMGVQKRRGNAVAVLGKDCGITGRWCISQISPRYLFFIVSQLSLSHPGFTLPHPSLPREAIKALSAVTVKAAVATSVDLLICEPTTTYPWSERVHLERRVQRTSDKKKKKRERRLA